MAPRHFGQSRLDRLVLLPLPPLQFGLAWTAPRAQSQNPETPRNARESAPCLARLVFAGMDLLAGIGCGSTHREGRRGDQVPEATRQRSLDRLSARWHPRGA